MTSAQEELKLAAVCSTLRTCQVFAGLSGPDIEEVAGIAIVKTLAKEAYLFLQGQPSQGFYIVQKGAINVHRVSASGKEQVIHVFRSGESFAEATLATDAGYPGNARAVESSQIVMVQKSGFLDLLKRRPELALGMLGSMSAHLRVLVCQLEDLTLKNVETRLANWLVNRCPDPEGLEPTVIQLTTTKRVLAAELGTVSETLSRTLAKFRDQGLIEVKGKSIIIKQPLQLMDLLRRYLGE